MVLQSSDVKKMALELGADLCGVASADRFKAAPPGHHPRDLFPACQAVIVLACRFPGEDALDTLSLAYTRARNAMVVRMDALARRLAEQLQGLGVGAFVKRSMGPGAWDADGRYRDTLSLKHAAVLAGLGKIGRNSLLINDRYGNMLWLSAVLVDVALQPDTLAAYKVCLPGCRLCVETCPVNALESIRLAQLRCNDFAYRSANGALAGEGPDEHIVCNACRVTCPHFMGITAEYQASLETGVVPY
jgi:epoxyqueuosine reductase